MNASVKMNQPPKVIVEKMDSVSLCLSKGLGAPAGSVLASSKAIIDRAYRIRKLVGGGLRQAGIIASAGIYALDNNIERLEIDHKNALLLAKKLKAIPSISVDLDGVDTNMVFITIPTEVTESLKTYCFENSILINADSQRIRLVTHLDINDEKIDFFVNKIKSFFL